MHRTNKRTRDSKVGADNIRELKHREKRRKTERETERSRVNDGNENGKQTTQMSETS